MSGSEQINTCIKTACAALNREPAPDRSIVDKVIQCIKPYGEIAAPNDFYQWFCSMWQSLETLHSQNVTEAEWATLVERVVGEVQDMAANVNPKLRAMCASYVLASLSTHQVAQTRALRLLIQMSCQYGLVKDKEFFKWIINIMKQRIDAALEIKNNRDLFVETLIDFFYNVEAFNHDSIAVLCHTFSYETFKKTVDNTKKKQEEKFQQFRAKFASIAKLAVDSAFNGDNLFDFEILRDAKLLFKELDDKYKSVLTIFVEFGVHDFDAFLTEAPTFIKDNNLNEEKMYNTIRMLTLISLVQGKDEIPLDEAEEKTKLAGLPFKRLVINLNETKNAILKIVSENGHNSIQNKYCQPRLFDKDQKDFLDKCLTDAIQKLEATTSH